MSSPLRLYSEAGYNAEACEVLLSTFEKADQIRSLLIMGSHFCGKTTVLREFFDANGFEDSESGEDLLAWPTVLKEEWKGFLLLEASIECEKSFFTKALSLSSVCLLVFRSWKNVAKVQKAISKLDLQKQPKLFILIHSEGRARAWQKSQERKHCEEPSFEILDRSNSLEAKEVLLRALRSECRQWSIEEIYNMLLQPNPNFQLCTEEVLEQRPLCLLSIALSASLELNNETLAILSSNFKDCSSICPFLMLGHAQCGKSSLLDAMMGKGSRFCSISGAEGLFVWPYPVDLSGAKNVLLMEISGLTVIDMNDSLDKLTIIAMALSAVCGVCLEKGNFFSNLLRIFDLGDIAGDFLSPPNKYLVFVEKSEMTKANWVSNHQANKLDYEKRNVIFQGRKYASSYDNLISDIIENLLTCSKNYHRITVPRENCCSDAIKFSFFADLCTKFANITMNKTDFKLKYLQLKQIYEDDEEKFEHFRNWRDSVKSAYSLKLFNYKWESLEVLENTLDVLKANYELQNSSIVFVILGDQGIGKSTLLNRIVQSAASLPFREIFSTTNSTKGESEVLFCPLWVGDNRDKQCLLIDLECAPPTEIIAILRQEKMIARILALASLPCIVVSNTSASTYNLKKIARQIRVSKRDSGYEIDRILLFFHDKNNEAEPNDDWVRVVRDLETQLFEGRLVFRVLNKPNFTCSEIKEQEAFLSNLLAEFKYPLRKQDFPVDTEAILNDILACGLESVETLTSEQENQYNLIVQELGHTFQITAKDGELLQQFYCFFDNLKQQIEYIQCNALARKLLLNDLNEQFKQYYIYVLKQEAFHLQTMFLHEDVINRELQYFFKELKQYHTSYLVYADMELVNAKFGELIKNIQSVGNHFPEDGPKYERIIQLCNQIIHSPYRDLPRRPQVLPLLNKLPDSSISTILVVGGPTRVYFCNQLVEILRPFTFPNSQTFTEGNQYLDSTFYSWNGPYRGRIISFELRSEDLVHTAAFLKQAAIAYILPDLPTCLELTEILLANYFNLCEIDISDKPVTFLCISEADVSHCQRISTNCRNAECKQTTFKKNDFTLFETLYLTPKRLHSSLA